MTLKILEAVYFILKESIRILNGRTIIQKISPGLILVVMSKKLH